MKTKFFKSIVFILSMLLLGVFLSKNENTDSMIHKKMASDDSLVFSIDDSQSKTTISTISLKYEVSTEAQIDVQYQNEEYLNYEINAEMCLIIFSSNTDLDVIIPVTIKVTNSVNEIKKNLDVVIANGVPSIIYADDSSYDGETHNIRIIANESLSLIGCSIMFDVDDVLQTQSPVFVNAGVYNVNYSMVKNSTKILSSTINLTIEKAELTIQALDKTIVYGDAPSNNGYKVNGLVSTDTKDVIEGEVIFTYTYDQFDSVGTYQIIPDVSNLQSDNYTFVSKNGHLFVSQYTVTVIWESKEYTYNKEAQEIKASYLDINGNLVDLAVNWQDFIEYKEEGYEITASFKNQELNYKFANGSNVKTFMMNRQPVEKIPYTESVYPYDGTVKTIDIVSSEAYTIENGSRTIVGSQDVKVSLTKNYIWSDGTTDTLINKLIIEQGNYDLSGTNFNLVISYDGNYHNFDELQLPDGLTAVFSNNPVRYCSETPVFAEISFISTNSNYKAPNPIEASIIINPIAIEFEWSNLIDNPYDGKEHLYQAVITNSIGKDNVSLVYENDPENNYITSAINAGSYTAKIIGLSGDQSSNYFLAENVNLSANWKISKVTSNVTDLEITHEDDGSVVIQYNTTVPTSTSVTVSDSIFNVNQNGNKAIITSNVSNEIISANVYIETLENENCTGVKTSVLEIISNHGNILFVTGYEGEYDGLEHKVNVYGANGLNVKFGQNGTIIDGYNPYRILPGKTEVYYAVYDSSDVMIIDGYVSLNITKVKVTITANSSQITFGDSPTNNGYTVSKEFTGIHELIDKNITYSYDYTQYGSVGSYLIIPALEVESEFYEFTVVRGTLNVIPKEIEIDWCDDDFTYTGQKQEVTASYQNISGEKIDLVVSINDFINYSSNSYIATAAFGNGEQNYKLPSNVTKEYHMKRQVVNAPSKITKEFIYNGKTQYYNLPQNSRYTVTGNAQVESGEYKVIVKLIDDNYIWNNNSLEDLSYDFIINKYVITINWSSNNYTYNGKVQEVSASYYDVFGEKVSLLVVMDEFIEYKNGGYRAEVKFANEETNYQLPSVASAIFTMKRLSINIPTSDKTNFVYNGKAQTYVITPNEYYTVTGNIQTNAGEYKVYVALNNASVQWADSTVQAKEYSFIIQKKVISFDGFEFEGQTFTYDGTAKSIYAKNVPADIEVTYSGNNQVEPGNYEVVLSLNYDHTNYSLDYAINGNTISKKMIILQKVVSSNNTALKDTVLVEPTLGLDISFSLRVNRIATAEYSSVRLEDGEVVLYGYSIGMLKDSLSVEYENEVKIKLKLPTDYNDRTFKIIDMNGNVIESEIDEQYIVFSSKLGSFLLVEIVPEVVDEPINLIWLIAVFGVISLGEIIFYSVYQAKRKKKGVM